MKTAPNKALHRTAIPLRSIAAGELGRYAHHDKIRNLPNLQAAYRDQIPLNGNLQSGNLKEPKD